MDRAAAPLDAIVVLATFGRGFEIVTYIMDGTFEHQDSYGGGGMITNGDTQWLTAGGGLGGRGLGS